MAVSMTLERAILKGWASIQASSAAMTSGARVMFVGLRDLMSNMDAHLRKSVQMSTHVRTRVDMPTASAMLQGRNDEEEEGPDGASRVSSGSPYGALCQRQ